MGEYPGNITSQVISISFNHWVLPATVSRQNSLTYRRFYTLACILLLGSKIQVAVWSILKSIAKSE